MEDVNPYQQEKNSLVLDENDTTFHNFDQVTNTRQAIGRRLWYENSNDEDVQELDKDVELTKIISLKTPSFLDIVT